MVVKSTKSAIQDILRYLNILCLFKFKTIPIFSRKETVSIADIENIFKKKRHDKQTRIESVKVRHFILTPQASFFKFMFDTELNLFEYFHLFAN